MNIVVKVSCDNFDDWKKEFDGHDARASVCDESRTTVGKVDDKNAIVMMYDVDMQGMQKLMMSDYLQKISIFFLCKKIHLKAKKKLLVNLKISLILKTILIILQIWL